jgi:serine/threonine protein kinase
MFMSPEAATGRPVDVRSDIYAAANIIFLMLTGRGPFDDQGDVEMVLKAHVSRPPPPLSLYSPDWVPESLEAAVAKGLEKDPNQRFQTASEFGKALYDVVSEYRNLLKNGNVPEKPNLATRDSAEAIAPQPQETSARSQGSGRVIQVLFMFALLLVSTAVGLFAIRRTLGQAP